MDRRSSVFIIFLLTTLLSSSPQAFAEEQYSFVEPSFKISSPFSVALDTLQKQINYTFKSVGLLRRALTHASFSEENNKALSISGASVIETSIALQSLIKDVDISAKDLNRMIADASKVESSCNAYGTRLGLQNTVRVSHKTNASAPAVVCGAFRAVLGAIAVDGESSDEAGLVYGKIRRGFGKAMVM
ncbi:Ribonuclease [Castilleja foliolosa]|uniref:Ribonuclease n=1 Tax=Castilleja foliolosa TaxID=1961234 RepID=A0ABD3DJM3_9LAMI